MFYCDVIIHNCYVANVPKLERPNKSILKGLKGLGTFSYFKDKFKNCIEWHYVLLTI